MKILAWYIDLNGIENNNSIKHPYPYGIKKCETLIIDAKMVFSFFKQYQINTGLNKKILYQ
jgi:hypothetical protein